MFEFLDFYFELCRFDSFHPVKEMTVYGNINPFFISQW